MPPDALCPAPPSPEMAEYDSLLAELAENITPEDLDQLKSACKEDIPSERHEEIATSRDWFGFLEKHKKLDKGEEPLRPAQGLQRAPGGGGGCGRFQPGSGAGGGAAAWPF